MLRSEPRLHPDALDDLDRLDQAIHAGRRDLAGSADGTHPVAADATDPRGGDATGDLDRELLDLVAAVREDRPALDAGARMRLDERAEAAKQADASGAGHGPGRRVTALFPADRRWRAGLALAAVVAVAVPVGVVARDGIIGGGDDSTGGVVASSSSVRQTDREADDVQPGATSAAGSSGSARGRGDSSDDVEQSSGSAQSTAAEPQAASPSAARPESSDSGDLIRESVVPTSPTVPPLSPTRPAPLDATRRVIRDVTQTIRVRPGDVARSAGRVTTIVQDAGGYLASSEVRERGSSSGASFQVVVPTGRLDATVAALSRIGQPVRLQRASTDVTDRAVSLDDQLRDLRADRAAARLALARTVDAAKRAARRRELNLLSSRVSALQGRRDELRRQTATSRIDLRLTTSKAADDDATPPVDDGSWGIGDAWDDAGRVLEVGGGVLLIGGVIVLPPLALVLGGLTLRRRAAARRREEAIDAA